jgi:hypothetical protein
MATLDFNMEGVKPAGEYSELGEGEYLVRIEGTEKKGSKDKFYENGTPHEDNGKNFYLNIGLKVGSGPNEGHIEFERLNLWNTNSIAVNIAKSTMLSIQNAIGVHTNNSDDWHGKFMMMRIKKNSKGALGKSYYAVPADMQIVQKDLSPAGTTSFAEPKVLQPAASAPAAAAKPSWAV